MKSSSEDKAGMRLSGMQREALGKHFTDVGQQWNAKHSTLPKESYNKPSRNDIASRAFYLYYWFLIDVDVLSLILLYSIYEDKSVL